MAVKPSGSPLSLSEIQTEFGGSNPISLSEYYRGGGLVPNGPSQNANIAASGAISMGGFYGAVKAFQFTQTISTNTTNYNLRNAAVAAGWDQSTPLQATVTINSGIYVSANSTGVYAFDTGASFPAGSSLSLVNNGFIVGMGGAGGRGADAPGSAGAAGGPAVGARVPISITNNGTIAGGGGGGGGGANRYFTNGDPKQAITANAIGGGGGGGRTGAVNSAGGGGGGGNPALNAGAAGTASSAGGGSAGATVSPAGYSGTITGGAGGAGGNWGASGASGANGTGTLVSSATGGPFPGGAGGAYVHGNNNITWVATGTRLGGVVA